MHQRTQQRTGLAVLATLVLAVGVVYGLVQLYRADAAPAAAAVDAGAATTVAPPLGLATTVTPIGTVVTSDGRTLYRFEKDVPKPPTSNCKGQCATTWPPVLSADGTTPAIAGVDESLVGTVRRDGSRQVTLKGWPLYTYSGDTAPGETNGEGVGGTWHAIGVDGKPAADAAVPARPAPRPAPAPVPDKQEEKYPSTDGGY
jgi:predicted lipoprotein with Yx(FWY)xxD motif